MKHTSCGMKGCGMHHNVMDAREHENHHYAEGNKHAETAKEHFADANYKIVARKPHAEDMSATARHMDSAADHYKAAAKVKTMNDNN